VGLRGGGGKFTKPLLLINKHVGYLGGGEYKEGSSHNGHPRKGNIRGKKSHKVFSLLLITNQRTGIKIKIIYLAAGPSRVEQKVGPSNIITLCMAEREASSCNPWRGQDKFGLSIIGLANRGNGKDRNWKVSEQSYRVTMVLGSEKKNVVLVQ